MAHNVPWNAPPPTYDAPSYTASSTLTPYLQLPHLLSLTWLAYPILSLAFVAFRLQLSLASSQDAVTTAKENLLASCQAAEGAATSTASMPRFMAIASNQQFADAVNGTLNGARATLVLALTVMEGIINFIIDIYRSTFLCFLELVIRGGLAILIGAVQELNNVVQSVTSGLRTSIQNDISNANSVITTAINAINKVNPFGKITAPQIAVPSLDALQNVTLPASFEQALTTLNNTLPTFDDLKQKIESVIDTPFELLKKDINDTFGAISFNSSILPVPAQNNLVFCNQMDTSIVDDLGKDLIKIAKIGTLILILLVLLLIGLNCLLEWYKWRCMKAHMEYTRQAWVTDPTIQHAKSLSGGPQVTLSDHNMLMLSVNSTHPLITRITNNVSHRLRLSPSQHTRLQWFFNYISHPPAMACLLIGVIGLLSVEIQLIAVSSIAQSYEARSASTASDFSNLIASSINASMYNQSATYANQVNGQVDAIQSTINDGVFGWVNTTTVTLNNTVNEFYNDIQNAVTTVFNNTILESPAQDFIRCLIGSKVVAIEQALTFLHDNLQINMPRVNDSVLVLSPASVNEVTTPIANAAIGGGQNGTTGLIPRLVNSYVTSLKKERLMFFIFIALWGFVVLMGLCVLFWHSYGKGWIEAYKRRKFRREQRAGVNGLVVPFKDGMPNEKPNTAKLVGLPSFTPLPSPKARPFISLPFGRSTSPSVKSRSDHADTSRSGSSDSLDQKEREKKGWTFFAAKKVPEKTEKRQTTKLKAIGRKAMGKEQLVDDRDAEIMANEEPSLLTDNDADENQRNTVWFSRIANMLGPKRPTSDAESSHGLPRDSLQIHNRPHNRPKLRIVVDPPPSTNSQLSVHSKNASRAPAPVSRWSASPGEPSAAWKNLMHPAKKSDSPRPPIGLPMRPKPRRSPFSVDSTSGAPLLPPIRPTPFAPPLHHGFSHIHAHQSIPPTPILSPRHFQSPHFRDSLVPPSPWQHRRVSSVPVQVPTSVTPVTRLLTATAAGRSPGVGLADVNPFVTPFDDEHRVRIEAPARVARKSIPTNPFSGQGFAV